MNTGAQMPDRCSSSSFCALAYLASEEDLAADPRVFLFVLKLSVSELKLQIDQGWRQFVRERDYGYIQALLADVKERTTSDPEALFQQVSSLSVGPVVAQQTGLNLGDYPDLLILCRRFVEL
jgi:hypothetical protein